jgi:hypothetical protein
MVRTALENLVHLVDRQSAPESAVARTSRQRFVEIGRRSACSR